MSFKYITFFITKLWHDQKAIPGYIFTFYRSFFFAQMTDNVQTRYVNEWIVDGQLHIIRSKSMKMALIK
ncbi:MAG: hypothetical protein IPO33_18750 [Saprospiraceae bacterium]|nr:hypothetical protein [Candidatus Brachybacter algidus]